MSEIEKILNLKLLMDIDYNGKEFTQYSQDRYYLKVLIEEYKELQKENKILLIQLDQQSSLIERNYQEKTKLQAIIAEYEKCVAYYTWEDKRRTVAVHESDNGHTYHLKDMGERARQTQQKVKDMK